MKVVSLFSCGGIGDLGYLRAGLDPIILSDIDPRRLEFASKNIPNARIISGDIRLVKNKIISSIKELCKNEPFILSMTPPCQGMSQNGIHTIMKAIKEGKRDDVDHRNYLITDALEIIEKTKPKYIFFENVPEAERTWLFIEQKAVTLTEYIHQTLIKHGYVGDITRINFADYKIPQTRRRVVGLYSHGNIKLTIPEKHSRKINLKEAIGHLPKLDALKQSGNTNSALHPTHSVRPIRPLLYEWIANTKQNSSAFTNNQCPSCSYINKDTDLYCSECELILKKPHIYKDGQARLIRGYTSSYRRMNWIKPANTITTRSAFASSSYNLHPEQNRVLSIYECALLQGIDPSELNWEEKPGTLYPSVFLREIIGEAIPPTFTEMLGKRILDKHDKNLEVNS